MFSEDLKDFNSFIAELQSETDRGLPLVGAALLDNKLSDTLSAFLSNEKSAKKLVHENNAVLGSFSARLEMCFGLGLIDAFEYHELNLIRKIRNEFAHQKHGINFQTSKIKNLCSLLKADLPLGSEYPITDARFRFVNSVITIVSRLYYRPAYVQKEQRVNKDWVSADMTRWRKIDEETPPENTPVLVISKNTQKT